MYEIYMSSIDEYDAAIKIAGSMKAWRSLCSSAWFLKPYEKHGHDTTGIDSAPGLASLATAVGAEQWLKDPWRVMRIQENHARIAQEDSETKQKGVWLRARRRFQAAAYGAASEDLYLLLTEEPTNARALYLLAVSRYLMGDKDSAKGVLERLLGEPNSAMALKPMERWWALELNKRLGVVQRGLPK